MPKFKIFTWNYGKSTPGKLDCIANTLFTETDTIYVVGLQEVSTFDILQITNYIDKITDKTQYNFTYGRKSSTTMGFDLLTFIIYPKSVSINFKKNNFGYISRTKSVASSSKSIMGDTKGYLWIDLVINNVDVTVVNIHLPFQNSDFSSENFKMLYNNFQDKTNVIIFGDYNTRSTVDDTCLTESSCSNVLFEKNAKGSVSILQDKLNECKTIPGDCGPVKEKLISNDYLNAVKSTTMNGYNEAQINFLPSYKFNNSGIYSLKKGDKKRLVGYADRILVKGANLNILSDSYKLGECLGNDHLPVMVDVELVSGVPQNMMQPKPQADMLTDPLTESLSEPQEEIPDKYLGGIIKRRSRRSKKTKNKTIKKHKKSKGRKRVSRAH